MNNLFNIFTISTTYSPKVFKTIFGLEYMKIAISLMEWEKSVQISLDRNDQRTRLVVTKSRNGEKEDDNDDDDDDDDER